MARTLFVILLHLMIIMAVPVLAQNAEPVDPPADMPTFNLRPTDTSQGVGNEDEDIKMYEPNMPKKKLETSLTLGYWNLATKLVDHSSIIYKYTDEYTYYGDVELNGESAFNPQLRVNYQFSPWFAIEPFFDISVSEYTSSISNHRRVINSSENVEIENYDPNGPSGSFNELGEFDSERRSNITLGSGVNMMFYPYDYGNFGKGRFHPYMIGGMSRVWMSINSNYTDQGTTMWRYSGGLGFRMVADDMISIRFEMLYNHIDFNFAPNSAFAELDEGTQTIPVFELIEGQGQVPVTEFEGFSHNSLSWALGFIATF
jgi:hypothetical protein